MKLSEAKAKWKEQWLAFRVDRKADDPEGEVLLHDPDKSRFDERLLANGIRGVYITYAGEPMAPDIVAMF